MLTRNFDQLSKEVEHHVECDKIRQGSYWDGSHGCFIGCLSHSGDTAEVQGKYGLPIMLLRIAEDIFESLPLEEAQAFFAALPTAVGCDNKDLSKVGWQFLASELRSLPPQPADITAAIEPVIAGMDLLAAGQEWSDARAYADIAVGHGDPARAAARAAVYAARAAAARAAAEATEAAAARAAAEAAEAAAEATATTAACSIPTAAGYITTAAYLRQRDLLLRLIADGELCGPCA
jgi:hypothetical protein